MTKFDVTWCKLVCRVFMEAGSLSFNEVYGEGGSPPSKYLG